ncbi:uncharacterized protein LOC134229941 [Saccostrea cucullata]|uniref:uncharacterized protein LOC134229941 n=1 Tax=Saccostrea cuccullata TaxID=36930 RepID=UPI002ED4A8D7
MTKIKVFDGEQARVIKNDALFKKENADSFGKESHRGTETEIKADNSQKHKSQSHVLNRKQSGSVLTYEGDANSDGNGGGQTRTGLEAESTVSKVQHSPGTVLQRLNYHVMIYDHNSTNATIQNVF